MPSVTINSPISIWEIFRGLEDFAVDKEFVRELVRRLDKFANVIEEQRTSYQVGEKSSTWIAYWNGSWTYTPAAAENYYDTTLGPAESDLFINGYCYAEGTPARVHLTIYASDIQSDVDDEETSAILTEAQENRSGAGDIVPFSAFIRKGQYYKVERDASHYDGYFKYYTQPLETVTQ